MRKSLKKATQGLHDEKMFQREYKKSVREEKKNQKIKER